MDDLRLLQTVEGRIHALDIEGAIAHLKALFREEQLTPFSGLLGTRFTNDPISVLADLDDFVQECEEKFEVEALFLEMNAFEINYDEWHFRTFAYAHYESDPKELDWLLDWNAERSEDVVLIGLESVQRDYQSYQENELGGDRLERACEIASLLVVCKYLALVRSALRSGRLVKDLPVLANVHDFNIIGRFVPPAY